MGIYQKFLKNMKKFYNEGFTLVEIIIAVGMMSTFSSLLIPSFLNWVRTEKVNAYTRELREYFRVVRLDARRWGYSCNINTNLIDHNAVPREQKYQGFTVSCDNDSNSINSLAPSVNNSIFQVINKNFKITPNGRISSDESIVIVIGSQYFLSGAKLLNCLIIKTPTGHITKGKFVQSDWITDTMKVSEVDQNTNLKPDKCISS